MVRSKLVTVFRSAVGLLPFEEEAITKALNLIRKGSLMARSGSSGRNEPEPSPASASDIPDQVQRFLKEPAAPAGYRRSQRLSVADLRRRLIETDIELTVSADEVLDSINRLRPARLPVERFPEDLKEFLRRVGRGDEIRPLTVEDRQGWEEYLRSYMDDVAMFEVLVTSPDAKFSISEFAQPDPSHPQSNGEVAWNERFLTPDGETVIGEYPCELPDMMQYRVVFAIHSWKPDLPLRSSYGELALPQMAPLPERLWRLTPYEVPT